MFNAPLDHFGVDAGKHGAVFLELVVFFGKTSVFAGKEKGFRRFWERQEWGDVLEEGQERGDSAGNRE